ncbi:MAG: tetratricopeptide repeat protein [Aquificaceae bacterium]
MRKKIFTLTVLSLLVSCGGITKEEFDKRTSILEDRIAQLEERQRLLEERNVRAEARLDNLSEGIASLRLDVERLKLGRTSQPPEVSTRLPEPGRRTPTIQRDTQAPQTPTPQTTEAYEKEYEEALSLYNLRQLNQAKERFIEFIRKYPKTPLTDNAYLWLGVVYRDLGELNKAEAVWLTLVERCEKGEMVDCNKVPSALLQLARLYEQRGDSQKSKEFYEAILKNYPLSEEANVARTKLGR